MNERAQVRSGWRKAGLGTGRGLTALLSAAIVGTMGYGWWAFGDVDANAVTTDVIAQEVEDERIPLDGAVDMLLVGIDSRVDAYGNPLPRAVLDMLNAGVNDGERNTDTMILVHIPVDGTRAVAISFPRDSWVELAGDFGKHRLNSAFAYAYNDAREQLANTAPSEKELDAQATVAGRKNLIATVQNLIGNSVTIDRYAEVNLLSFYEVTNAIGGVEVCLNAATHDPKSGANFAAGRQTVAGAQALAFVRQRYGLPNGDLDRIVRQQAFLGAIANKVLSADMLTSPTKVRQLVSAVQRSVILSDGWQLSTFAAQMSGLSADGIDFYTIPTQGDANIGGADVLRVDPAQVSAFVTSLVSDEEPEQTTTTTTTTTQPPSSHSEGERPSLGMTTVDVLNGSDTKGLATSVRGTLTDKGFQPGTVGDVPVRSSSVIRHAPGERNLAEFAAGELGWQFAYEEDDSLTPGRLAVVLGTDYPPDGVPTQGARQPDPSTGSATSTTPKPQLNADGTNCVN